MKLLFDLQAHCFDVRDYRLTSIDIDLFEDDKLLKFGKRFGVVLQYEISHFLSGDGYFMCGL